MHNNARWSVGKRELVAMAVGVILYAGITGITSFANLGEAIGGDIRPAIAIPIFFGFVFGPVVGFVVGAVGNLIYDAYAGWLQFPLTPSTGSLFHDLVIGLLLNWEIGNGFIGFVPGLRALHHRRYRSLREQAVALVFLVFGIVGGVGFASLTDLLIYPTADINTFLTQFPPIVWVNLLNALLLVPLLLFNYERLDLQNRRWLRSKLLYRFLLAILVSAALPTILLSIFLTNQVSGTPAASTTLPVQLGLTILLTLIFTLINALLLAQSILRPLLTLTEAAHAILENRFTSQQAADFRSNAADGTELSYLQQMFGQMAEEVIAREEKLRQQVDALQIMIDERKRTQEVNEITESDFFRSLQDRAAAMRARQKRPLVIEPQVVLSPGLAGD
jgi:energy-coupling factor transport system substrate-specific component